MQVAIVGLGRMGKNVALHLLEQGVSVVAYNRSSDDVDEVVGKGAAGAYTLEEIAQKFSGKPVVVILYLPAGAAVEEVLFGVRARVIQNRERDSIHEMVQKGLAGILPPGSIVIDGGNSFYKDSQKRFKLLKEKGIHFLDMGTSGGLEGARTGACLMVGGEKEVYATVEPLLIKIACKDGLGYFGPAGAGHFVKMVHNAVEYGMMGAIGEGMNLISNAKLPASPAGGQMSNEDRSDYKIDLAKVAKVWSHGSIVSGLLMDKTAAALTKDPQLELIKGEVPRGETEAEMEWLETLGATMPVISAARRERVDTRTKPSFVGKVVAALRREFGGHKIKEK